MELLTLERDKREMQMQNANARDKHQRQTPGRISSLGGQDRIEIRGGQCPHFGYGRSMGAGILWVIAPSFAA
ncbi:hypothetical protein PROH_09180, partial [Prochlorothrix hollandica PCC 9006 = CALU 1027]